MLNRLSQAGGLAIAVGVAACTGFIGGSDEQSASRRGSGAAAGGSSADGGGSSLPPECGDEADSSPIVLRRLTRVEYQLTLQELFRLKDPPDVTPVPEDSDQEGFRTIAALESVSDQHLRAYVDVAADQAVALLADAERRAQVLGCDVSAAGCLESFVASFGKLAYRRPLEAEEAADLVARAEAAGADAEDRFRFVIEGLLSSPSFLFRVEAGSGQGLATLGPLELASRLSFVLWGRTPSAELLARAEAGELEGEGLGAVAAEMLGDPRAQAFYRAFFKQWLDFEALRAPNAPPAAWSDALLPDMITETELMLDEFAWSADLALTDALTANFSYLNPALGAFYGVPVSGEGFTRTEFPSGHQRENTGLLTHASLISAKNDGDLLSVRGKWLRQSFLCEKVEVPPGLLESLESELSGLSYLEVVQRRNSDLACAGCHALIDPLGVGFAQYDAIGYYDASVSPDEFGLPQRFEGAAEPEYASLAELAQKLRSMPQLGACIAEKVFVYTQGRFPAEQDHCAVQRAGARFAEDGFRFAALLQALVEAPEFRVRRAP